MLITIEEIRFIYPESLQSQDRLFKDVQCVRRGLNHIQMITSWQTQSSIALSLVAKASVN